MLIDAVAVLAGGVVTEAVRRWLGEHVEARNAPVNDIIEAEVIDRHDRQQVRRQITDIEGVVRERLLIDAETPAALDETERALVVETVARCFNHAILTERDFDAADTDAAALARTVRNRNRDFLRAHHFSPAADRFFRAMLVDASAVLIAVSAAGPVSQKYGLARLLRAPGEVGAAVSRSISGLSTAADASDATHHRSLYLRTLIAGLDQGELVGFTLPERLRRFRLSGIYTPPRVVVEDVEMPVSLALHDTCRMHVTGVAGSGKTTLLRWIAIACARGDLPGSMSDFRDLLPLYVPARGLTKSMLGRKSTASVLALAMTPGADGVVATADLRDALVDGGAVILVDGLDEVAEDLRRRCIDWLRQLVKDYPRCRFVVSSRVGSVAEDATLGSGFVTARILPMDDAEVVELVERWFRSEDEQRGSDDVLGLIRQDPRLRDLVSLPLLCAVVCAVYRDRGARALKSGEIFDALLEMLVERRDIERGLPAAGQLPRTTSLLFLEEMAAHMVRNDIREWPRRDAEEYVADVLRTMPAVALTPRDVLRFLIDRSGVLVEPVPGTVGFLHQTFLALLAARHFVLNDDIGLLAAHAHRPTWRQVVVLSAHQLRSRQSSRLLELLLDRIHEDRYHRRRLAALLQQCAATVPRLDPILRDRIEQLLRSRDDWGDDEWRVTMTGFAGLAPHHDLASWLMHRVMPFEGGGIVEVEPDDDLIRITGTLKWRTLLNSVMEWREKLRDGRPTVMIRGPRTVVTIADEDDP